MLWLPGWNLATSFSCIHRIDKLFNTKSLSNPKGLINKIYFVESSNFECINPVSVKWDETFYRTHIEGKVSYLTAILMELFDVHHSLRSKRMSKPQAPC